VLVQESGQHGGTASGPVVRDIIKAYYDKKAKNTHTETTVEYQHIDLGDGSKPAAPKTEAAEAAVAAPQAASAVQP
jgi:hypothetical protein